MWQDKKLFVYLSISLMLLGACLPTKEIALLDQYIGASEEELVRNLGVPTRTHELDEVEKVFAYDTTQVRRKTRTRPEFGRTSSSISWIGASEVRAHSSRRRSPRFVETHTTEIRNCTATFFLTHRTVTNYKTEGNGCYIYFKYVYE